MSLVSQHQPGYFHDETMYVLVAVNILTFLTQICVFCEAGFASLNMWMTVVFRVLIFIICR